MKQVNMHQAKSTLSRLVDEAAAGEEIIIAKNGKPAARLMALPARRPPKFGTLKGKIWISDDFDAPLPPDVLKLFGIE